MLLSAHNLNLKINDKNILDNVSIAVEKNDFITIVGPNGSGKSSLIKTILGIIKPDSGTIEISPEVKIGYIPQKFTPDFSMPISAKDFLLLNKNVTKDSVNKILDELEIDYGKKMLYVLSGGELQKVMLARALLNNPNLLILDEPVQNLDIGNQLKFYNLIQKIYTEKGCSILMISHDLHMVMAISKKVLCLFHHVCCTGKPMEVAKDPAFINIFGADMAKMLGLYQNNHDHSHAEHIHDENCSHNHGI
jgi:zinc transport system ATP-binding protein